MEKEFIPYDIALAMKELGFDEPCFGYFKYEDEFYLGGSYKNSEHGFSIARPLYQQAFRWFKEEHDEHCLVQYHSKPCYSIIVYNKLTSYISANEPIFYETYEEAELACLRKLIEITKNKS